MNYLAKKITSSSLLQKWNGARTFLSAATCDPRECSKKTGAIGESGQCCGQECPRSGTFATAFSSLERLSDVVSRHSFGLRHSGFGIHRRLLSRQYGTNLLAQFRVNGFGRASAIDNAEPINPLQMAEGFFHRGLIIHKTVEQIP